MSTKDETVNQISKCSKLAQKKEQELAQLGRKLDPMENVKKIKI